MKTPPSTRRHFLKQATTLGLSAAAFGRMGQTHAAASEIAKGPVGPEQIWVANIFLEHPKLSPRAVQFAIFAKDPLPGLAARFKRLREHCRAQLQKVTDAGQSAQMRLAQMIALWNYGFRYVRGDEVQLLGPGPVCLRSNGPGGRRWVMTKTADAEGEAICWCIPIELYHGQTTEARLTNVNTFDLAGSYEALMG
jgi:hypothetical protein